MRADANMKKVIYIAPANREHELLPLLEGMVVFRVKSLGGLLRARPSSDGATVVIIDNLGRWALFGVLLSTFLRIPLVIRLRAEFFREERDRLEIRRRGIRWIRYYNQILLVRLLFWKADAVIYNSFYLEGAMGPFIRGKSIGVVHNPHVAPSFRKVVGEPSSFPKGRLKLLTVTNMNLRSKVQPIFDAVSWMPDELWDELDIRWVICGAGHHRRRLENLVREKGLQERVHVLGRIQDIASAYKWCDVLIHLTRLDTFPNAPMEAMGSGRPIITNVDSCGTREQVFDGENGFVVGDNGEFVAALRAYAEKPALREKHGQAGKTLVEERFCIETQRVNLWRALEGYVHSTRRREGWK